MKVYYYSQFMLLLCHHSNGQRESTLQSRTPPSALGRLGCGASGCFLMTSHGCRMTWNVNQSAEASERSSSLRAPVTPAGGELGPAAPSTSLEKVNFPFCFRLTQDFAVKFDGGVVLDNNDKLTFSQYPAAVTGFEAFLEQEMTSLGILNQHKGVKGQIHLAVMSHESLLTATS